MHCPICKHTLDPAHLDRCSECGIQLEIVPRKGQQLVLRQGAQICLLIGFVVLAACFVVQMLATLAEMQVTNRQESAISAAESRFVQREFAAMIAKRVPPDSPQASPPILRERISLPPRTDPTEIDWGVSLKDTAIRGLILGIPAGFLLYAALAIFIRRSLPTDLDSHRFSRLVMIVTVLIVAVVALWTTHALRFLF